MKKILIALMLLGFSIVTFGQNSPDDIIATFWKNYETGDGLKALDELYKDSPWVTRAADDIENLKTQFKDLPNLIGDFQGYELLASDEIGGCYKIYIYLAKFDRQPITIQFDFYKPKDKWIMQGFTYNFDFDKNFEEVVKAKTFKD